MTTVREALQQGASSLAEAGSTTPRLDAELLLGHVIGRTRTQLLAWPEYVIDPASASAFDELIKQRGAGAPVAYLTGTREFLEFTLEIGPGALVPRPETEMIVEWGRQYLNQASARPGIVVLDIGTGSGAIALGLAMHPSSRNAILIGSDVSAKALHWAALNREKLGLRDRLHLVQGDLASWFGGKAHLVIANLPYLRADQFEGRWELAAEPVTALDGGREGLELIERLVDDLPRILAPDGAVALEIDPSQASDANALLSHHLPCHRTEIHRDLTGLNRFITAVPDRDRQVQEPLNQETFG